MTVAVKICGLNTPESVRAVARANADYAGFNFFARSPRFVTPAKAAALAADLPASVRRVALVVDADDGALGAIVAALRPGLVQLHGAETPERSREIASKFDTPVMKVLGVSAKSDLARADAYAGAVERIMFDAKPPKRPDALPGGNAVSFDWTILSEASLALPWMLAGGLTPSNVAEAIRISGARAVDVASGVETAPGVKSPELIREFVESVRKSGV
ncbi:MAG: phosphoribosylanthranilate isomerase [Tagaea sp.]